jgi:hypothetical protein
MMLGATDAHDADDAADHAGSGAGLWTLTMWLGARRYRRQRAT